MQLVVTKGTAATNYRPKATIEVCCHTYWLLTSLLWVSLWLDADSSDATSNLTALTALTPAALALA